MSSTVFSCLLLFSSFVAMALDVQQAVAATLHWGPIRGLLSL